MLHAPEVVTADRLTLRRPALTDAADIYAYAHDPEVTRSMVWPTHTDIAESLAFLEACRSRWESSEEYCWVITITPENRAIGAIGCRIREYDADFGYVGGAPGKINLYVGKTPIKFNIPEAEAVERLVDLIREHGKWVDPEPPAEAHAVAA